MATKAPSKTRKRAKASAEKPIYYRGIKLTPLPGRRSPLARAFRDYLIEKYGHPDGDSAKA